MKSKKNILFVSGHPAQIHNFKLVKQSLEENGHKVFWLATRKDISEYLLNCYSIDHKWLKKPRKSIFSKALVLIQNTLYSMWFLLKHDIDIVVSRVSPYLAISAFLTLRPHIVLTDTESAATYDEFFAKYANTLLTAKSYQKTLRKDQVRFSGNIELFYLHPKRFKPMERQGVLKLLGLETNQPFIIMRFVSWDAFHDEGLSGFTDVNKIKAVELFSKYANVFISSEGKLPESLQPYQIRIPPEKMHDVLSHAQLFFGESSTMASESAVLGTPAVFLNENWFGSTDEEATYNLLYPFRCSNEDQQSSIKKGVEILSNTTFKKDLEDNHRQFLNDKIDLSGFFVWFIENYPQSFKIMKENPDYQEKFR